MKECRNKAGFRISSVAYIKTENINTSSLLNYLQKHRKFLNFHSN